MITKSLLESLLWSVGRIPKNIYHYTSSEALQQILVNNKVKLHFTSVNFLNDKQEGFIENYNELIDEEIEKLLSDIINEYNFYICCFSEKNDELSLWNYYLKNDTYNGYNIGFTDINYESIKKLLTGDNQNKNFDILKVTYDIEDYKSNVNNIVNDIKANNGNIQLLLKHLYMLMVIGNKNKCFSHEKEVRIILRVKKDKDIPKFKCSHGVIVPYHEVYFSHKIIDSITVSPIMDYDLASKGLRMFLDNNGFKDVKIKESQIPVRW